MRITYSLCPDLQPLREGRLDETQLRDVQTNDLPEAQRRWASEPELRRVGREIVIDDPTKADEVEHVIGEELLRRADAQRPRPMLAADIVEPA